jgi:hypothetical protein
VNGSSSTDDSGISSYAWSMPGALVTTAVGPTGTATYLTAGAKNITLTVTDAAGLTNSKTVQVSVLAQNQAPTATITAPAAGASVTQGTAVAFAGTGSDPEDGTLTGTSLTWTSSLNGTIGTGTSFSVSNLSVGSHVITLSAKDAQGLTTTATRSITVAAAPVNQKPVSTIVTPLAGSSTVVGTPITFTGTGVDPEQGNLTGNSLIWTSNYNGGMIVGYGASVTTSALGIGTHVISLLSIDAQNQIGSTSRTITITATPVNSKPIPVITSPTLASATANTTVSFSGSAMDAEDGAIPASGLTWSSNINGLIGSGTSFSTTALSVGTHTITLTAKDSQGATNSVSIVLTIVAQNQAPTAAISSPGNGTSVVQGANVTFVGTGTDPEQGSLAGSSLTWSSSIAGVLGTGVSLTTSSLAVGTHTITLTVRDAQNASHSTSITVTVTAIPVGNQAPTVTITSPVNGQTAAFGQPITFTGTGTDPEEGAVTGSKLIWTINQNGGRVLGYGNTLTLSNLSVGTWTIALIAVDSQNKTGSAQRTITITP